MTQAAASIRLIAVAVGVMACLGAAPATAQDTGVLLFTDKEQIPLKTYAEFMRAGILQITSGAVKDIPTIDNFRLIRCGLTGWRPVAVMVASERSLQERVFRAAHDSHRDPAGRRHRRRACAWPISKSPSASPSCTARSAGPKAGRMRTSSSS